MHHNLPFLMQQSIILMDKMTFVGNASRTFKEIFPILIEPLMAF